MRLPSHPRASRARGMSLIELMIALVLGLLIAGVAGTVFLSNRRTYSTTESLGRIQENTRTAFELMARDVREAAGNACEQDIPVVNVLKNSTDNWWTDFTGGVTGYDNSTVSQGTQIGTAPGQRVAGTDAIDLKSAVSNGVTVAEHQPVSAQFKVNTVDHGLNDGDIAMVCDFDHAAIFQVSNAQPGTNETVVHNEGNTVSPGNNTTCLSVSGACSSGAIKTYGFGCRNGESPCDAANRWPSTIVKLRMTRWFVGNNPAGGTSLYQASVQNTGGVPQVVSNEIVEGVSDMQLQYLVNGASSYVDASPGLDWTKVVSVRINLSMEGDDRVGTDGETLKRNLSHTVAIRNRAP